ncbi:class I SAM-dependent methyltransferase [Termitidicoccus mucosus]|uniref:class I SAM-dependent methyltransferase n=1 Tax=Termitidicoccus mucosus TaxID=1184151 RepID=UPI0009FC8D63
MRRLLRKIRNRLFAGLARKEELNQLYNQFAGLIQIQNAMQGSSVLRPMRGWAISPDAMAWILADLQERESPTVIEFGSGQSTIILATVLKQRGGRLVSVEHDSGYLGAIQRQAKACNVTDVITFALAPLVAMSPTCSSYDLTSLPDCSIDLALIDGPPFTNGLLTRLVPLRWATTHLIKGGAIFLDDAARGNEQECLRQLRAEFPGINIIEYAAEKGLAKLEFI